MITINDPTKIPYSSIQFLAVAVKQIRTTRRQNHVGILYKTADNPVSLLHLKWHHQLCNDFPDPTFLWIPCDLDSRVAMLFAEWLGVVWARNQQGIVPFSVEFIGRYFDVNGTLVRSGAGEGLTCATLITALFSDYGLPLIDTDSWPKFPRLKDKLWQRHILEELAKNFPEHAAKQRPLIGRTARYRPEQVAGAFGVFNGAPVDYQTAAKMAASVEAAIEV